MICSEFSSLPQLVTVLDSPLVKTHIQTSMSLFLSAACVCSIVLLGALVSCSAPGTATPSERQIVERLTHPGKARPFSTRKAKTDRIVFDWNFTDPGEIERWHFARFEGAPESRATGLFLAPDGDSAMSRDLDISASDISAIRLKRTKLEPAASMRLFWAAPGTDFDLERSLKVEKTDHTGDLIPSYTFEVAQHSRWTGEIGRLRIDLGSSTNKMSVTSLQGVLYEADANDVVDLIRTPWSIDLRGDVRPAVVTADERPFVTETTIPSGSELRFACGVNSRQLDPVVFTVSLIQPNGSNVVLDTYEIQPDATEAAPKWHERSIDLTPFAGETVTLRFESFGVAPSRLIATQPVWGNIRILAPGGAHNRPNIVLILLDTLRQDHMSLYGYERTTTPQIDAWASSGPVVFDNAIAQAPWTLPSHTSLFTGFDAITHGVNTTDGVPIDHPLIAERLRDVGYVTRAITGGGILVPEYGLLSGFDHATYWYASKVRPHEVANDLDHGLSEALTWLEGQQNRPFFLFFHTYEIHAPYRPREPYFTRFHGTDPENPDPLVSVAPIETTEDKGFLLGNRLMKRRTEPTLGYDELDPDELELATDLYDAGVAYADERIGQLLQSIANLGLAEDTVVVITSDHGESLGENGFVGHASLQPAELIVPLILAIPGETSLKARIHDQVRLMDVAPTLLELAGIENDPNLDARSLVPLATGSEPSDGRDAWSYAASTNFGVALQREHEFKYTFNNSAWPRIFGQEQLFEIDHLGAPVADSTADSPTIVTIRDEVRSRYASTIRGLRLKISNRESAPIQFEFGGPSVRPLRVKSVDLEAVEAHWRHGRMQVVLPPAASTTFIVEGVPFGDLEVVANPSPACGARGFRERVRLEDLASPWTTELTDGEWHAADSAAQRDSGELSSVTLWIEGTFSTLQDPQEIDAETVEQLRQLGYLE